MTLDIQSAVRPLAYTPQPASNAVNKLAGDDATVLAALTVIDMDPAARESLIKAATQENGSDGSGKSHGNQPQIRDPQVDSEKAWETFAVLMGMAQVVQAAPQGSADPMKTDAGAPTQMAEAVSASTPSLVSHPLAALMVMLREIILKSEARNIELEGEMKMMQRETTIFMGEKMVDAAISNVTAQAFGAGLGIAFGAGNAYKQIQGIKLQDKSFTMSQNKAQVSAEATQASRSGVDGTAVAASSLRPARDLDGQPVAGGSGANRQAAQVQADIDADRRPMNKVLRSDINDRQDTLQASHAKAMVDAARFMHIGQMLGVMGQGISATATASVGIQEKTQLAESELARTDSQLKADTARAHDENEKQDREFREATAQLAAKLVSIQEDTANYINNKIA